MTDIDFPALAAQGVEAWNRWRDEHPEVRPNLSRAYLYGCDLCGFNLSGVNLERACLIGANLHSANLSGACLQAAYANSSDFGQADLTGANLQQGGFSKANFAGANLSAVTAQSAEFAGANFTGTCLVAWQIDGTTSLHEIKGTHLYFGLPPAGRQPRSGEFRLGELATFLQQQIPGRGRASVSAVPSAARWQLLLRFCQRTHNYLHSDAIPALRRAQDYCNVWLNDVLTYLKTEAVPAGRRALRHILRLCQHWQRRLLRQLRILQQATYTTYSQVQPAWAEFVEGDRPFQRQIANGHQRLRLQFNRLSRRLQIQTFRQGKRLCALALATERLCTKMSVRAQRRLRRQLIRSARSLRLRTLRNRRQWTAFVQGNSRTQRRLTIGHKRLRVRFFWLSQWMRETSFRQSERLYTAGLVSDRNLKLWAHQAREHIKRSKYLQAVSSDLQQEYRRHRLPFWVGSVGAIALVIINPFLRSDQVARTEPTEPMTELQLSPSQPVPSPSNTSNSQAQSEDISSLTSPVAKPLPPIEATSVRSPLATVQQKATSASAIALPCPAAEPAPLDSAKGYQYQDGSVYYGKVVNGQPADGIGTMTYPSGNRYDGGYQNGQRSGCGTFSFVDGRRYVGQFTADQFNGLGTWILENGERYIGEFAGNQCNGQGSFIAVNGTVKSGTWQDGKLSGTNLSCEWGSLQIPLSSDN